MVRNMCKLFGLPLAGWFLVGFLVGFVSVPDVFGQRLLTLQDAIAIALEKSYAMKSLRLQLTQAEENLVAAKGEFRTHVDLNLDAPSWQEQVSAVQVPNALPVYNSTGTMRVEGQLDVRQPLPTDGDIILSSRLYQSNVSTYLAESEAQLKRKDFLTSLSLQFQQPLFAINRLKLGLKNASLNFERASRQYTRSELDVVYNVTQSFFDLYSATRSHEIAKETVEQQKEAYDLARLKYEAGLIPEVEALQMEVDLASAQNELLAAEATLQRQHDSFLQVVGLELNEKIAVKTDFAYSHFDIDLERAIAEGLKNRSEIREREIDVELAQISVKEADARSEIRGDLYAFYDLTGVSDASLPYGTSTGDLFESSWDDLQRRPRNRGVVFTLSVPIWDWGVNSAEVASAKASLRNAELQLGEETKTVERSIRDVVRSVREAENRLKVMEKGQEVAQRSYDISLERFNNGDITSTDLALDRNRLTSAKMAYLNAYITYQLSVADLKRKTLWDFERNRSLIKS